MRPRDLLYAGGKPYIKTYAIPAGSTQRIPANPDRCCIVFWATNGQLTLRPDESDTSDSVGIGFEALGPSVGLAHFPMAISYKDWFTLVTIGWNILNATGGTVSITVMEAYWPEGTLLKERKNEYVLHTRIRSRR